MIGTGAGVGAQRAGYHEMDAGRLRDSDNDGGQPCRSRVDKLSRARSCRVRNFKVLLGQ